MTSSAMSSTTSSMWRGLSRGNLGPFNDAPGSAVYLAEGLSPEEMRERIAESVALATARAPAYGLAEEGASVGIVSELDRLIFETTFRDAAGNSPPTPGGSHLRHHHRNHGKASVEGLRGAA